MVMVRLPSNGVWFLCFWAYFQECTQPKCRNGASMAQTQHTCKPTVIKSKAIAIDKSILKS